MVNRGRAIQLYHAHVHITFLKIYVHFTNHEAEFVQTLACQTAKPEAKIQQASLKKSTPMIFSLLLIRL